jgi:hypothetical protein
LNFLDLMKLFILFLKKNIFFLFLKKKNILFTKPDSITPETLKNILSTPSTLGSIYFSTYFLFYSNFI